MAFYQASWLILLSPLFSFAVIIFGTRMWDLATRPRVAAITTHAEEHAVEAHGSEGADHGEHGEADAEDHKVPRLTTGGRVSGYVGILFVALACIYSWLLLLDSARVINISGFTLPADGVPVLSYDWFSQGTANYVIAFLVDTLAIAMMVVVTTISLLVQFYSQGYMENSAGYARFFSYLSLFTFSMLVIVFAQNFLVIFIGWELVGLSSYLLIGFWINKRARPEEDRLSPASAAIEAFITTRVGDVGFMIGIMILFVNTGTFNFADLESTDPNNHLSVMYNFIVHNHNQALLTAAMILVFCC